MVFGPINNDKILQMIFGDGWRILENKNLFKIYIKLFLEMILIIHIPLRITESTGRHFALRKCLDKCSIISSNNR